MRGLLLTGKVVMALWALPTVALASTPLDIVLGPRPQTYTDSCQSYGLALAAASVPGTLAATLLKTKILWPYIGITSLDESGVRAWIEANTDRDNFYLKANNALSASLRPI